MAIHVFLAVLEYYLFAALVGIFLPFGLLSSTKFLAEKAVGAVVAASVKLMVLAFVLAVVDPVLSNIHFAGPDIKFNELWSVFLTVCALMFFCWKAPSLAAALLGGSPHLGAGDLLQAASTPIAAGMALGAIGGRAAAGVSATDQVDEHWFRLLKGAAVASLLAATTQAVAGNTDGFNPTVPQVWARNGAGEINQVGQQLTRRNLNIQPTITVRPGYSVNVIVTKDIIVAPYSDSLATSGLRP
jgi:type IV secretory pathway TrbL component